MFEAFSMESLQNFHFLRPWWLLLLTPVPLLIAALMQQKRQAGAWRHVIDESLMGAMLSNSSAQKTLRTWPLFLCAWLIAAIALAGPAFKKLPQPVSKNQHALIILLDMSASMAAQDIKPSRAIRAIQKVTDIVRDRRDGLTALIAYAGDAHTVTPLTDDTRTIETLLPALSPFIMPAPGSRPDRAVALARQLATDSGIKQADLLLITDGVQKQDAARVKAELRPGLNLNIIALGTRDGAPIPLPTGGFLRDSTGKIIIPTLETGPFNTLAEAVAGRWLPITLNDDDWQSLINTATAHISIDEQESKQQFDLWRDDGFWLIFFLLPFALLLFRRGALVAVAIILILPINHDASAETAAHTSSDSAISEAWQNAWQTGNQRGAELFESDPAKAAKLFTNKEWQGSAAYQAGDYDTAIEAFSALPKTAVNLYNLGNALAQSNFLKKAISAYDEALAMQPDFPQAAKNRAICEELLKQQQQQNKQDQHNQDGEQSPDNGEGQQDNNADSQNNADQNSNSEQQNEQQAQGGDSQQQRDQQAQQSEQKQSAQQQQDSAQQESSASEQEQAEQQQKQAQAAQQTPEQQDGESVQAQGLSREEQAAMDKWLQRVPDNPGNLLQRKFLYQYRQQSPETNNEDVLW